MNSPGRGSLSTKSSPETWPDSLETKTGRGRTDCERDFGYLPFVFYSVYFGYFVSRRRRLLNGPGCSIWREWQAGGILNSSTLFGKEFFLDRSWLELHVTSESVFVAKGPRWSVEVDFVNYMIRIIFIVGIDLCKSSGEEVFNSKWDSMASIATWQ